MKAVRTFLLLASTFVPSALRLAVWRRLGWPIGRHCHVSPFTVVVADRIEMGDGCVIDPLTFIYAPGKLTMGERSRVASFVRILGLGGIRLGPQTAIGMGCLVNVDASTEFSMGARSGIGPRGTYFTHGGSGLTYNMRYRQRIGDIRIGEDCWLGMAVTVYPDITVGDRTVVFPGVTVASNLPGGKAIVPAADLHRAMPLGVATFGVDDRFRLDSMERLFRKCAEAFPMSEVTDHRDDTWELLIPRHGRLILLREADGRPVDVAGAKPVVVWRLRRGGTDDGAPTFLFEELTVSGGWSPFAETMAAFLSQAAIVQFAFEGRTDGGSRDGA